MKRPQYCITDDCFNPPENRDTGLCSSCARAERKRIDNEKKEQARRKAKLSTPKKIYAKPNRVSDKRKVQNAVYYELKSVFLLEHPECELRLIGCENFSVDVHHLASGSNKATNLNNTNTWKASCRHCHKLLHDKLSAEEARIKGLKI